MAKKAVSDRPICHLCNRPFDPTSPGATLTMGPTCAKKAGLRSLVSGGPTLWSDTEEEDLHLSPRLKALGERLSSRERRPSLPRDSSAKIPADLYERYVLAKIAFDELLREFSSEEALLYGEKALAAYHAALEGDIVEHSFLDPSLQWLEPEHDLHLILDHDARKAYYWRVFNGTYTFLEIDPRRSQSAKNNVAAIVGFSTALKAHRATEEHQQLSLIGETDLEADL